MRGTVNLLEVVLETLSTADVRFCVIGKQAVNVYVDPVQSPDVDIALANGEADRLEELFGSPVEIERSSRTVDLSLPASELRIQFQTDPRYEDFPDRAELRRVLGHEVPVAALEDVLQGKIWAAIDGTRRPSRREDDLTDISRLLEAYPELRASVPPSVLDRLLG